ncbi:MAG: iron-sulfur cluster repair di-iron protein [Vicinamibacterales bacterium]
MTFDETTPIARIAAAVPASVRVFERHGIDYCCGGAKPIGDACAERGLAYARVSEEIDEASRVPTGEDRDWRGEPLGVLIGHIVATYHEALREELPRLRQMVARVREAHRDKAPLLLDRLEATVTEVADDLRDHLHKEELVLFPAIERLALGRGDLRMPIEMPIAAMEHEHARLDALLKAMRELTAGYTPPAWACATCRALFEGLASLERELHAHVHLENNVLFPRALALTGHATGESRSGER